MGPVTPRLSVHTICSLIIVGLCVAAVIGICWTAHAIGGSR